MKNYWMNPLLLHQVRSFKTPNLLCIRLEDNDYKLCHAMEVKIIVHRCCFLATGKCYHRVFGCSGATIQVHLFTVADKYIPCERCIPYEAQNYKIPNWYYEFLKLLNQYVQDNPQIEATDPSLISAETVKASQ